MPFRKKENDFEVESIVWPTFPLADSINPRTQMLVTNAVYFKDSWDFAFDPLSDEDDNSFDPGNGRDKINVKMMLRQSKSFHLTDTFVFEGILPTVQFRAISMPYAVKIIAISI